MATTSRIHNRGGYEYEEFTAHSTITPGMLLEVNSDGEVLPHDTASGAHEKMFAMENALEGDDATDTYAAAEKVCVLIAKSGTVVNALCAGDVSYSKGDAVESNGDGTLKKGTTSIVGYIETAADLTSSADADTLVPVRIA